MSNVTFDIGDITLKQLVSAFKAEDGLSVIWKLRDPNADPSGRPNYSVADADDILYMQDFGRHPDMVDMGQNDVREIPSILWNLLKVESEYYIALTDYRARCSMQVTFWKEKGDMIHNLFRRGPAFRIRLRHDPATDRLNLIELMQIPNDSLLSRLGFGGSARQQDQEMLKAGFATLLDRARKIQPDF